MYSPLEIIRVGTGPWNGSFSAGATQSSCSSLSHASSSREPGTLLLSEDIGLSPCGMAITLVRAAKRCAPRRSRRASSKTDGVTRQLRCRSAARRFSARCRLLGAETDVAAQFCTIDGIARAITA
jgi:hypothetical protein